MKKTIEVKCTRMIAATPSEAYAAWLNPKVPGTPWHEGSKLILQPKVDGMFFWHINKTSHYGRFTQLKKAARIQHTWMSQWTDGLESTVTVTFKKKGKETEMTLVHSGLPNNSGGKGHQGGWDYFLDKLAATFAAKARRK